MDRGADQAGRGINTLAAMIGATTRAPPRARSLTSNHSPPMQATCPAARALACHDVTVITSPRSPNRGTIRYRVWEPGRDLPQDLAPRELANLAAEYAKREAL